ncbi:hypothetical protein B0H11DRAFT_2074539 [Mycena galericulata]|nr:hypothetical protein B0H11DRAFT_2074539 [Mycena galericulata]
MAWQPDVNRYNVRFAALLASVLLTLTLTLCFVPGNKYLLEAESMWEKRHGGGTCESATGCGRGGCYRSSYRWPWRASCSVGTRRRRFDIYRESES